MQLSHLILGLLLTLSPSWHDREEVGRFERLATIAAAIEAATDEATCGAEFAVPECSPRWRGTPRQLAALLVAQGYSETRFDSEIHALHCGPHECGAMRGRGGVILHRARGPWQIEPSSRVVELWSSIKGPDFDSTLAGARAAARILAIGLATCHTLEGAVSLYATGHKCQWSGAAARVQLAASFEPRLSPGPRGAPARL